MANKKLPHLHLAVVLCMGLLVLVVADVASDIVQRLKAQEDGVRDAVQFLKDRLAAEARFAAHPDQCEALDKVDKCWKTMWAGARPAGFNMCCCTQLRGNCSCLPEELLHVGGAMFKETAEMCAYQSQCVGINRDPPEDWLRKELRECGPAPNYLLKCINSVSKSAKDASSPSCCEGLAKQVGCKCQAAYVGFLWKYSSKHDPYGHKAQCLQQGQC